MSGFTESSPEGVRLELLRRIRFFSVLGEEEGGSLLGLMREVRFPRGGVIFRQFDEGNGLYLIIDGSVRISRIGKDGREITLALLRRGDFFGEMSLLDGQPRAADATSVKASRLLFLEGEHFRSRLLDLPAALREMLVELSKRLRAANQKIEQLALGSVFDRLFHLLGHIGRRYDVDDEGRHTIRGGPTHQEFAEMAGTSRETVTRSLAAMESRGLISLGTRSITLLPAFFEEERLRNRS